MSTAVRAPNPNEFMELVFLTIMDRQRQYDALYLFGPPQEGGHIVWKMLKHASLMYEFGQAKKVVILGTTFEEGLKKGVTWMGVEYWRSILEELEMPETDVVYMPSCFYTSEESEQLLRLSKERGWKRICFMAMPHHLPRCFLHLVAWMRKLDMDINIYALPLEHYVNWDEIAVKKVVGGGDIEGPLLTHITAEYNRIVKYTAGTRQETGGEYLPPCATIPELKEYLAKRNARDR